jgi:hypothetical protein
MRVEEFPADGRSCPMSGATASIDEAGPLIRGFRPLMENRLVLRGIAPTLKLRMLRIFRSRFPAIVLVVLLTLAHLARAENLSWNKIRYEAGTIDVRVNPFDWNTTLKVLPTGIELSFEGRKKIRIERRDIVSLSCGAVAHQRVHDMLLNSSSSRPVSLFGLVRSNTDHMVAIEFKLSDGSSAAILLVVQKDSYASLLQALVRLDGKPILGPL